MHSKQGYGVISLLIILSLILIVAFQLIDINLRKMKREELSKISLKVIDITDEEYAFLKDLNIYVNDNLELKTELIDSNFDNILSTNIKLESHDGMSVMFSKDFIKWKTYKENKGRPYYRYLKYKITQDNKIELYLMRREETL